MKMYSENICVNKESEGLPDANISEDKKGDRIKHMILEFLSASGADNPDTGKTTREISNEVDVSIYVTRFWLLNLLQDKKVCSIKYKKTYKWFLMENIQAR